MDDLLREAIADAKAVRETALENAKIALEEAFTPRLQSMLSKKIQAEMEDSEEGEEMEEMEAPEEEEMEEMDAEEMEMDAEEMRDAEEMEDTEEEMEDAEEMRDAEEMEDEEEGVHEEEMEDEEEGEMREEEEEEEDEVSEEEEIEDEDDLDLESVLAELEADLTEEEDADEEEKVDEVEDKDEEEKVDENDVSSEIGSGDNKVKPEANDSSKTGAQGPEGEGSDKESGKEDDNLEVVDDLVESEDLDLDEVLKALTEEEDAEEEADKVEELQAELKETREVVQFMRDKLNEVNLLNAKLLFSNKLFRAYGLNNNQKLKVVETFDRTKNLREVKLVYATLAESFKRPSKPISESVSKGSSSKPVASTKPAKQEVLSEGAEMKARFKKLANIL